MRRLTAFHAAIGKIERRLLQIEEAVIAICVARDEQPRREPRGAARETRIEAHVPVGGRSQRREYLVVLGNETQFDVGEGLSARKGTHENMDAIRAGKSGEP